MNNIQVKKIFKQKTMMHNKGLREYIQLRELIKKGNSNRVKQFIMQSAKINVNYHSYSDTLFHWAIRVNDLLMIRTLLDAKADVHVKNHRYQSPLDLAIRLNHITAVEMFLNEGGYTRKNYRTMVYQATANGNSAMVQLIINYGVRNNVSLNLKNSLNLAIGKGCVKIVQSVLPYCKFELRERSISVHVWRTGQNFKDCISLLFKNGFTVDPRHYDFYFVYVAILNGHSVVIQELLKVGMDPNLADRKTGFTLLHASCHHRRFDITKMLVDYKASANSKYVKCPASAEATPEEKNNFGVTPLDFTVNNLDMRATKLLLENGANIIESKVFANIIDESKDFKRKCKKMIELLIEYITDGNVILYERNNFLQYFAKFGKSFRMSDYNTVKYIVTSFMKKGVDLNAVDSRGLTLLYIAIYENFFEMVEVLLQQGANATFKSAQGQYPLHVAACQYDSRFANLILSYNVQVDVVCDRNWTSLHYAACYGSVDVVQVLLDHYAKVDAINEDGNTPLFLAVMNNNTKIVQILLDYNAEVNVYNNIMYTPLFLSTMSANLKIIKMLLKYKADVNARDRMNCRPLHHATAFAVQMHTNATTVQMLLDHGADVNAVDNSGSTALHYATSGRNLRITKTLLENKADINATNNTGQTPFFYAMQHSNIALIRVMLENNANANIRDKNGRTPIFYMSLARHELVPEIIRLLLQFNVDIDCYDADKHGSTLLFNAEYIAQNFSTVKSFIEIEQLKEEKIKESNITFYHLLKKNIHYLSKYANNENVRETLESKIYDDKFPLTIDLIRDRFAEGLAKNRMMEVVQRSSYLDIFSDLPVHCMDKVFSFVTTEEIGAFLGAVTFQRFQNIKSTKI